MKLNLACGGSLFLKPWLNVDIVDMFDAYIKHLINLDPANMIGWPEHQIELSKQLTAHNVVFMQRDLLEGFPDYADGSVEAIYCGQMIEHLNPIYQVPKFLLECHRLLKPGGRIRLTTPCLNKLLTALEAGTMQDFAGEQPEFFRDASPTEQLSLLMFGASGPDCTRTNYEGHFACYTAGVLCEKLRAAGFEPDIDASVKPSDVFAECTDYGMSHSFALEGVKP